MQIARMSEDEAYGLALELRWAADVECPWCGGARVYIYASRLIWKCASKNCRRHFSLTSRTSLGYAKMEWRKYFAWSYLFAASGNGLSSLASSRMLGINQRTTFRLGHLLRDAFWRKQNARCLKGHIEIDGCFVGGHREHVNRVKGGRTYRVTLGRFHNRAVVIVARERGGKSVGFVGKRESDALDFLRTHIAPGSTLYADQARAWDSLKELYEMLRVNHREAFVLPDGASTNNAESFFARVRKLALGVHGRISGPHLPLYVAEMVWRADTVGLKAEEKMQQVMRTLLTPVGDLVQ